MSSKNALQESFHKYGLAVPKYYAYQIDGPQHNPVWMAEVELATGERIKGDRSRTKGAAEQSAALIAISLIRDQTINSVVNVTEPIQPIPIRKELVESVQVTKKTTLSKGCLLIDGENLPKLSKFVSTLSNISLDIMIFIGYHHHMSEYEYGPTVKKILVPTTHQDGVDSCIQVYVGIFLSANKYDRYFIGTRDHFGSALIDLIQNRDMPWTSQTAILITTENQLKKYL